MKDQDGKGDGGGFGRRGAKAYQAALEAVFAIPVAGGLGYWADAHFGTTPILLLVGLVLGFASFVMRIVRMRKLVEDPEASNSNSDREEREQR